MTTVITEFPARTLAVQGEEMLQSVADILDEAALRGRATMDSTRRLRGIAGEWASAGGSAAGTSLLMSAQGTIGMLNVTGEQDPLRTRVVEELRQLKLAWRALSDDPPPE